MGKKYMIYIIILTIFIVLGVVYFFFSKQATVPENPATAESIAKAVAAEELKQIESSGEINTREKIFRFDVGDKAIPFELHNFTVDPKNTNEYTVTFIKVAPLYEVIMHITVDTNTKQVLKVEPITADLALPPKPNR